MRRRLLHRLFCPVHEDDIGRCTDVCLPNRRELHQVMHGYCSYWHDRLVVGRKPGPVRIGDRYFFSRRR
jgi:hypothetical protein